MVDGRETPPSCNLSEGGVVYRQRKHPLHLTFQAREGVKVVDGREVPPSHNLSKGGDGGVSVEGTPPPPYVSSEGGGIKGGWWDEGVVVGGKETPSVSQFK